MGGAWGSAIWGSFPWGGTPVFTAESGIWGTSVWGSFPWNLSFSNLRFPGQYADAETALNQNWFRDYDPTIGRYIQSDPLGLVGGTNTYAYAASNPVRFSDPMGLLRGGSGGFQNQSGCGNEVGQVIYVCVLMDALPNACRYWCERAGVVYEHQRNLGIGCPAIIIEPAGLFQG